MSTWIIKKDVDNRLLKNMIVEETDVLHTDMISLGIYSGGFSSFTSGTTILTEDNNVVKIISKQEDFDEYFGEFDPEKPRTKYRWIGPLTGALVPSSIYYESNFKSDITVPLDTGLHKVVLAVENKTYTIRGSKKIFNEYLRLIPPSSSDIRDDFITEEKRSKVISEFVQEMVGPQGPRGKEGRQGDHGPAGLIGPIGDDGSPGPQGPIGSPGNDGKDGKDGKDGEVGTIGFTGGVGEKGDTGKIGPKGDRGSKGDVGEKGGKGSRGVQGAIGPRGPQGEQGSRGARGGDGEPGVPGPEGTQGPIGKRGPRGVKGDPGRDGTLGKKGIKGDRGYTGDSGNVGERGDPGIISTKYPLVYNPEKQEFSVDKKFFEKLLNKDSKIDQQLMNKFINAASSGGGGVGVLLDGKIKKRSSDSIDFTGDHWEWKDDGRWVSIRLSKVPRMFTGISADVSSGTYATGDFHLNTDTGILYARLEDVWVEL